MSKAVIVVAGGTGSRMNSEIPKQFMLIHDKPVIIHTIERFLEYDDAIQVAVVVHKDYMDHWADLKKKYLNNFSVSECEGGKTRFDSVKNGLALVSEAEYIAVHDAARPLVSVKVIADCFAKSAEDGAAIPVVPVHESMREINGVDSTHVDRSKYVLVQTPQCFRREILQRAYKQEFKKMFTDDASVVESSGGNVSLVSGNRENIKITELSDLNLVNQMLC